jgi:hypothetical protein
MPVASSLSRVSTWLLTLIVVVTVYVGSWPPVDIKSTTVIHSSGGWTRERPWWVMKLYYPMYWASALNPEYVESNPLYRYWLWWAEIVEPQVRTMEVQSPL